MWYSGWVPFCCIMWYLFRWHTWVYNIHELAGRAAHSLFLVRSLLLSFQGFPSHQVLLFCFPWQISMFTLVFYFFFFLHLLKVLFPLLYNLPHSEWKGTSIFMSMQLSLISCAFQIRMKTDSYRLPLDAYLLITCFTFSACFLFTVLWHLQIPELS